ncbi:hypothetical protein GE061_011068 [Apolygus lucorum]|uniref:ZAD domain-containing protein n=1 Tax=Apolygus lucorum TaxID=248454 RepID=A0A8S9XXT7_APOLU|nr:hypothetical protein GE061_011068 [Apolygus lucorum]
MSTANARTERRSYFDFNVCRLCSFAKDKILPIFDTSGSKFDAKIKECLPNMKIALGDGKPQQICLECITKLNIYYEFLCLCIRSDSYFESYIRAFKLKEQAEQSLLNEMSEEWTASSAEQQQSDGLLVLNKFDQPLSENIQDMVVVVELKYKDGAQESSSAAECEGLEPPAECIGETNVSGNNEHPAPARYGNFLNEQQDHPTSQDSNVVKPSVYFRYDEVTKEYECAFCDKKFKRRSRLSCHLTRHTGIKPHACDKCEKSFGTVWELNIHTRIHKRDIVLQSHMVEHLNVHKKSASFHCATCSKVFRWRSNYKKHLKTHA